VRLVGLHGPVCGERPGGAHAGHTADVGGVECGDFEEDFVAGGVAVYSLAEDGRNVKDESWDAGEREDGQVA